MPPLRGWSETSGYAEQVAAEFRTAAEIIGEAVVRKGKELRPGKGFPTRITFTPSSIRLYSPSICVDKIQPFVDASPIGKDLSSARPYYILNWDVYGHGRILKEVAVTGPFING